MAVRARKPDGSKEVAEQIRAYYARLTPKSRRALEALHAELMAAAPTAVPAFSYRMPAVALNGRIIVWLAGWQEHVSLYPVTPAMRRAGGASLAKHLSSKTTLRFPLDAPLPATFIRRVVKARVAEMLREQRALTA